MSYLDRPSPPKGPPWAHNSVGASVHNALAGWWRLPLAQRTAAAAGNLVDRGWINEGFADEYASLVLDEVSHGGFKPDPAQPDDSGHVRLDGWAFPGRIADTKTDLSEQFGYNASWTVVRALVDEIGVDRMRTVLAAAADKQIPYVGAGSPEQLDGAADWRRFLDLLDRGIDDGPDPVRDGVGLGFQLKLLALAGYLPHLDSCAGCGSGGALVGYSRHVRDRGRGVPPELCEPGRHRLARRPAARGRVAPVRPGG